VGPLLGIVEGQFVGTKKTKLKNNFSQNYKNLQLLSQSSNLKFCKISKKE
jgi:hypothetical protein